MPIFEYKCDKCDEKFELLKSASDDSSAICPGCGSSDVSIVFSTFCSSTNSPSGGCNPSSGFS